MLQPEKIVPMSTLSLHVSPLSSDELKRYARHVVLRQVGGPGQQKLKAARVAVIGAGGLGSPSLLYLAAAGIGTIGIFDDDEVSVSNLQRQVLHATGDIGRPKIESAAERLSAINPFVKINGHPVRVTAENARELLSPYDLVLDGSDNFTTRYLMADVCEALKIPLVTAAIGAFDGSLTTLMPYALNEKGEQNPGYRDLFPSQPPPGAIPACAEAGVIGALPGILGSLQAMEAVKLICGIGDLLIGRLLLVDALSMRFETIKYRRKK